MSASEQEHEVSRDSAPHTAEPPTNAYEIKQMDTVRTVPGSVSPESQSTDEIFPTGRLFGPYRILEQLGAGGMGQVYKAQHLVMERIVALKIISPRLMKEPSACARFQARNCATPPA